ncbi:hypothetical protein [Devosia sp.]|uniref:hypothetical protein n=1 Tax=Devosia sp. TaxID=1871048 RepID=UPI003A8D4F9E
MSGKNDEVTGMAVIFAVLGAGVLILGMILFAALILVACFLTGLALVIWIADRPVEIFGETVTPHDARVFLMGGVAGAFGVPAFTAFCAALYGVYVDDEVWSWLIVGGYVGGSIGLEFLIGREDRSESNSSTASLPAPQEHEQPDPPPLPKPDPFKFASWDDEDERG